MILQCLNLILQLYNIIGWKRFRDDILTIWTHGCDTLESLLDYLNQIDLTSKIKFTMQVQDEDGIEFLELKLKLENSKIAVDVFAKPINSFTYVLPTSCYPRKSINNIPHGITLRLRHICDTDEKFNSSSIQYKNCLIAREYKPSIVNKHFAHVSTFSRQQTRQKSTNRKSQVSKNVKLITKYNPRLADLNSLLKKHMPLLCTDPTLKTIFPQGCINSVFKRNQSLKELLAPSLYPNNKVNRANSITSCNKCDICKNYLKCSNYFTCSVTNSRYYMRGERVLHCNYNNVIYLITCKKWMKQYVDSAPNFKNRFRIHKSNIKINKYRCGATKHLNGMCKNGNIFQYIYIYIYIYVYIYIYIQLYQEYHSQTTQFSKWR